MLIHYINDSCTDEWLRLMRTIEGELECAPDIHDYVSCLRPRFDEVESEDNE